MAKFEPGKSGNPAGRPKGSKNQITLLKESLELALREQTSDRMANVMERALELAEGGDRSMIKLLLELHMSKGVSDNGAKGVEKVSITVNGPVAPEVKKDNVAQDVEEVIDSIEVNK